MHYVCDKCDRRYKSKGENVREGLKCPHCGATLLPIAEPEPVLEAFTFETASSANELRMAQENGSRDMCANCGGAIGQLEMHYEWRGRVVCRECYGRLAECPEAPTDSMARRGRPSKKRKPKMPATIVTALVIYGLCFLAGCVYGCAAGISGYSPRMSQDEAALLGILVLFSIPAEAGIIVGLVAACMGRAWGAFLVLGCGIVSLLVGGLTQLAGSMSSGPAYLVTFCVSIAFIVCLLTPTAWKYYRDCDEYRHLHRGDRRT